MTEPKTIETVWPDKSFGQFGGHVLEHLFDTQEEFRSGALAGKRFRVRVTIEIEPVAEENASDA
jgi:hypothetical protein